MLRGRARDLSTEDPRELHPMTPAILAALMGAAKDDSISHSDFEPLLARFVCGWVSDEERKSVMSALTESSEYRIRLLEMRENLKQTMVSLEARDRVFERDPVLARTITGTIPLLMNLYLHWRLTCQRAFSDTLMSSDEKSVIQVVMRQIGAGLRLQGSAIAATRGENMGAKISIEPGAAMADLALQVDSNGMLQAGAALDQAFDGPNELSLFVVGSEGDWIFLGSSSSEGTRWELKVSQCPEWIGIPVGSVSANWFALTERQTLPLKRTIRLDCGGELFADGKASSMWLPITRAPAVNDGSFSIGFDLSDSQRVALREATIVAAVDFGGYPYIIGQWPVSDLPESTVVTLATPLPGVSDGEVELQSAITLSARKH